MRYAPHSQLMITLDANQSFIEEDRDQLRLLTDAVPLGSSGTLDLCARLMSGPRISSRVWRGCNAA